MAPEDAASVVRPSAGGIVVGTDGRIVLVEQHGNSWSFPKGGIEKGETPLEAALREIQEETGLQSLTCHADLGTYTRYSLDITGAHENKALGMRPRTIFLFSTEETRLAPADAEVTRAAWVTITDALQRLTHPKDKEFLRTVQEKVRTALQ